jgi:homospermidine synthase
MADVEIEAGRSGRPPSPARLGPVLRVILAPLILVGRIIGALARAIARGSREDATHLAAYIAFTGLLSLFPFLMALAALGGELGTGQSAERAVQTLFALLPEDVAKPLAPAVRQVLSSGAKSDILTIGLVVALWTASNGVAALRVALNRAYGAIEHRGFIGVSALQLGLVLLGAVVMIGLSFAVILGPQVWDWLVKPYAPKSWGRPLWDIARYGTGTFMVLASLVFMHWLLPARHLKFRFILPGAVLTTLGWIGLATLFSLFLRNLGNYSVTYGSLGSIVVVLVFFYASATLLLVGAHFNVALFKIEPSIPPLSKGGLTFKAVTEYSLRAIRSRFRRTTPMDHQKKHVAFAGRLVIVGFGSIGQGVLPLLLRHIDMPKDRITIVTAEDHGEKIADAMDVTFLQEILTRDNYRAILEPMIGEGDFLLNLSVDVSSLALIALAHERGALYLDTCIEPWLGGYTDTSLSASARSNYGLREGALALKAKFAPGGATAVLTHGANPGHVSHLVKQGLLDIAAATGAPVDAPKDRAGWGRLAQKLGVKVIHVAERDTQKANIPKAIGEFVNTWSIDGFVGEGCQPAELGWGTHERHFPADGGRHEIGKGAAIYLNRPGASVRVRTWTPKEGPFHGFLITHSEAISLADFLTVEEAGKATYRPTCHYAYHPCDDAVLSIHEIAGKNWQMQATRRLMSDEIISGIDELGVLIAGHAKGAYWLGSQLDIETARDLAPYNSATSLQVTSSVLAGVVWAIENPHAGIVEPEDMDFRRCLEIAGEYWGPRVGVFTDWTPLDHRAELFPEDLDTSDPWQFKNIRVG